jgi:hypothetical protein
VAQNYHPGDRLKEGTQTFILSSVQQKVWKKWGSHINKNSSPLFFTEIFHLLVEQTNLYY